MSMTDIRHRSAARSGLIGGFMNELGARYARYQTYRRTLEELSHLSDRDLADLGISRSMIRGIAYQAAYDR